MWNGRAAIRSQLKAALVIGVGRWQPAKCFLDKDICTAGGRRQEARSAHMILRDMRSSEWEFDAEHRASIQFAGGIDRTSVQLDQLLHEGQPDARALNRPAAGALDAMESFKNPRELITRNARSGVPHAQDHAVSGMHLFVHADRDTALEGKFKRVAQQIEHNL